MDSFIIEQLYNILNKSRNYTWRQIKTMLDVYSDDDLVNYFIKILELGLEDFSYLTEPSKHLYMEKSVEYLLYNHANENVQNQKQIIYKINYLIKKVHNLLKPVSVDPKNSRYHHGSEFLKRLLFKLKCSKAYYENIKYDKSDYVKELDEQFDFLTKIITEIDDYKFLEKIFDEYPELLNLINSSGYTLFDFVISEYLKITNNSRNEGTLRYYQSVLKLFIYSKRCYISDEVIKEIIDELKHQLKIVESSNLNLNEKEWRSYYLKEAIDVLGTRGEINTKVKQIDNLFYKYDVVNYIPSEIIESMNKLKYPDDIPLKDLTNRDVYTFDGFGTTLRDDALSFTSLSNGQKKLSFYVPLVADFLDKKSCVDRYARKRAETIYCHDKIHYMFPYGMSKQLFSLDKGELRQVLTFDLLFDKNYKLEDLSIYRGKIQVKDNLNFLYCDLLLQDNTNSPLKQELKELRDFNKRLEFQYMDNYNYNHFKSILTNLNSYVQKLIASYIASNQIPFIYRKKEIGYFKNELIKIKDEMHITDNTFVDSIIEIFEDEDHVKRRYTNIPYGNVTTSILSPIRDYASVASQYLILQNLIDGKDRKIKLYNRELEYLTEYLDVRHRKNKHFQTEYNKLYESIHPEFKEKQLNDKKEKVKQIKEMFLKIKNEKVLEDSKRLIKTKKS